MTVGMGTRLAFVTHFLYRTVLADIVMIAPTAEAAYPVKAVDVACRYVSVHPGGGTVNDN